MNQEELLKKIVEEVVSEMSGAQAPTRFTPKSNAKDQVTLKDYPLAEHAAGRIKTPTGKAFDDLTFQKMVDGSVTASDMRISPDTLEMQAQVAESIGRTAFAGNLRRAAELINVPDDRLLEIYNALRPYRSTKEELRNIADELEEKYACTINADFVREAAEVYEERGRLKENR